MILKVDDMDLKSTKLGKDVKERSQVIGKVLASIDNLDLDFDNAEIDVLGDAYEYLIGMFAQTAGKKLANSIHHNKYPKS